MVSSLTRSSNIASLAAQTCRRNSASIIFEAPTSLARTRRSCGEMVERSAPISVGAKRAAIRCSLTVSDTGASWAQTTAAAITQAIESFAVYVIFYFAAGPHPRRLCLRR